MGFHEWAFGFRGRATAALDAVLIPVLKELGNRALGLVQPVTTRGQLPDLDGRKEARGSRSRVAKRPEQTRPDQDRDVRVGEPGNARRLADINAAYFRHW
jgi:hypothetical protein